MVDYLVVCLVNWLFARIAHATFVRSVLLFFSCLIVSWLDV